MKFKSIFGILFIFAVLAIGCVTEFNAKLPANDGQILIVDGNIIENTTATFYLGKSVPFDSTTNTQGNFIAGAPPQITIVGSDGYQSSPAIYSGNGRYSLDVGTLDDNTEYGIQIEYEGNTYRSKLAKPLYTPEIDSVSFIQPDSAGTVSFRVSTHDTDTKEAKFYMWDYKEDWEVTAYYYTTAFLKLDNNTFYTVSPAPNFYCWRNNTSSQYLIGSTESLKQNSIINKQLYQCNPGSDRFSYLYSVNVNQKAISKGAYDYYLNKITLNENMGGLFTPQPSEVMGNIACITDPSKKVMGYIEIIKNTTQKRIFVYPNQITHPFRYFNCNTITNDSVLTLLSSIKGNYIDFYQMGYRPANSLLMNGMPVPEVWSTAACTDCVANGGSKKKPDFWPNNDQ